MIQEKNLSELLDLLSEDGHQVIAPCLGGIAHSETRDIGEKTRWTEGPEWMWRGEHQWSKDTYELAKFPTDDGRELLVWECTERLVTQSTHWKNKEPYLNKGSLDHLLEIFAKEYVAESL